MRFAAHVTGRADVTPQGFSVAGFIDIVKAAEEVGFARISSADGQGGLECFTAHGLMASITSKAHIGPHVTNPVTRDVGVMASAMLSLHAISNGRAFLTIGRGDGAVYNTGLTPASVEEMKEYFLALRQLLEEGETVHRGQRKLLGWPRERMSNPPLYLVVEGPRMLRLGGAIADGVYIGAGLLPEVIADAVAAVHAGALEAGRDPAGVDIWWDSRFSVAPTHEEALAAALESIASPGNHALRGGFQGKHIPKELEPRLVQFHRGYDYAEKGRGGKNARLMESLGLRDYFLQRFGVVGTPGEVVERLRFLESLGVGQISVQMRDMEQLRLFAREVMPEVSQPRPGVLAGSSSNAGIAAV